jgi:hypothetical protein
MTTYTVDQNNYSVNDEYYLQSNEILDVKMTVIGRKIGTAIAYVGYGVMSIGSINGVDSTKTNYFNTKCTLYEYTIDGSIIKNAIIFNKVFTDTSIKGYYPGGTLTIYPVKSNNTKIKVNNNYIDGTPKIKINGNWADGSAYVKIGGSWRN